MSYFWFISSVVMYSDRMTSTENVAWFVLAFFLSFVEFIVYSHKMILDMSIIEFCMHKIHAISRIM